MFKCTECEKFFDIKPLYCDCGNDLFEEINPVKNEGQTSKNFSKQGVSYLKERLERKNISVSALAIFLCSIVFSFIVLFWGDSNFTQNTHLTGKSANSKNMEIPDIDAFWDNKLPDITRNSAQKNAKENVSVVEKNTKNIVPQKVTKNKTLPAPVVKKTKTEQKQIQAVAKQKTNNEKKNTTVATKLTNTVSKTTTKTTLPKTQTTSVTTKPAQVVQQPKVNTEEMNNYKIALRNALFSKLSVVAIVGKGRCGIEFSVDVTGKLVNRAFTFQSDNKSVNDEVYKMLMRLPSFYPPPEGYNGEKIKMTFTFDNGSYLIDFTN